MTKSFSKHLSHVQSRKDASSMILFPLNVSSENIILFRCCHIDHVKVSHQHFHLLMINASRRNNCLKGLLIDGAWTEEPATIKEAVRLFFEQRFQETVIERPTLDGLSFQTIDSHQNDTLVGRFQEEEVKRAVWDCGSDKSPGPDGLTFKFIKQF